MEIITSSGGAAVSGTFAQRATTATTKVPKSAASHLLRVTRIYLLDPRQHTATLSRSVTCLRTALKYFANALARGWSAAGDPGLSLGPGAGFKAFPPSPECCRVYCQSQHLPRAASAWEQLVP